MGGATDWTDDDYSELIDINEPILPEYFLTFIPTVQSQIRPTAHSSCFVSASAMICLVTVQPLPASWSKMRAEGCYGDFKRFLSGLESFQVHP